MVGPPAEDLLRAAQLQDPLEGLGAVAAMRAHLDTLEGMHVENALREGRSWREIAGALGVSKQAAHRKWASALRARSEPAAASGRAAGGIVVTGRARLCVHFARQEAMAMRRDSVGTEHVLLGVLRDADSAAGAALSEVGVRLEQARRAVERLQQEVDLRATSVDPPTTTDGGPPGRGQRPGLPTTRQCRIALEQSLREAVALGDGHLGPEHLLLGMLRQPQAGAALVLRLLGRRPEDVLTSLGRRLVARAPRAGSSA
jgi:ATP-dependent Clp protease ATP-binding subunit ClpA